MAEEKAIYGYRRKINLDSLEKSETTEYIKCDKPRRVWYTRYDSEEQVWCEWVVEDDPDPNGNHSKHYRDAGYEIESVGRLGRYVVHLNAKNHSGPYATAIKFYPPPSDIFVKIFDKLRR